MLPIVQQEKLIIGENFYNSKIDMIFKETDCSFWNEWENVIFQFV